MTEQSSDLTRARATTDPALVSIAATPATPTSGQPSPEFVPRQRIGRYELLKPIGIGGMGIVYAAYDPVLDRQVAIKLVRSDRNDAISPARIIREGRALARLSHPNVVAVHEVSDFAGQVFLVMEYIKGTTLRLWLAEPRPLAAVLDMFVQAGRGLAAAHAEGLVHRDFKPDNVLIASDGRARVVDFGLVADPNAGPGELDAAVLANDDTPTSLTRTGAFPGTPAYMAPEIFAQHPADARSDQFSFCVALHEALYGARPFAGTTLPELQVAATTGTIQPAHREVPAWLAAIVRRGLAPAPEQRWPTMAALLDALAADPASTRRRRLKFIAGALFLSALVAATVLAAGELRQHWRAEQREHDAQTQLQTVHRRISLAHQRGDVATATRLFDDYVDDPRVQNTRALADAWLAEASRREHPDLAASAYARAFIRSKTPEHRLAALDGLATGFHRHQHWRALRDVLATITSIDAEAATTPQRRTLAFAAALGERDVKAALTHLDPDAPAEVPSFLATLVGTAKPTEYDSIIHIDTDFDLEGDGRPELLLHRTIPEGVSIDVVRADSNLTLVHRLRTTDLPPPRPRQILPLAPDPTGRPLLLGSNPDHTIFGIDAGALQVRQRWTEDPSIAAAVGDLDGDGTPEIYVGTGPSSRRLLELVPDASGNFHVHAPIPASDAPESDIQALLIADLDEDGRQELVMATGPWHAFDVRAYHREPDGSLRLRARQQLGSVTSIATLRWRNSMRLAASHVAQYASHVVFPPDRPAGEDPGVYILRLAGDQFVTDAVVRLPESPDFPVLTATFGGVADFNADGRDDLGLTIRAGTTRDTMIYLQRDDGEFSTLQLGQTSLLALAQLDGDPQLEALYVLSEDVNRGQLWIVGVGDQTIPPANPANPTRITATNEPSSPPEWTGAEELQAMGLHGDAAAIFAEVGRDADSPELAARSFLAAAQASERADDQQRAATMFLRASDHPATAEAGHRGAFRAHLRLGEHPAAAAALTALLQLPDLPDRSELATTLAQLQPIFLGTAEVTWDFSEPLDPGWEIAAPLALHRDPITESLAIETSMIGPLLSRPIAVLGGTLELDLELSIDVMEYSAGIHVAIVDDSGHMITGLYATASGGGQQVRRLFQCYFDSHPLAPRQRPDFVPASRNETIRLRVGAATSLHQSLCTLEHHALATSSTVHEDMALIAAAPGVYRLVIQAEPVDGPALFRGALQRLTIRGAQNVPTTTTSNLRHALVEGDHAITNTLLHADPATLSLREQLWQADLHLRSGALLTARSGLQRLLEEIAHTSASQPEIAAATAELHTLLRRDSALYGSVLASVAPRQFFHAFAAAWTNAVAHHMDEAYVPAAILGVLDRVDLSPLLVGDPSDTNLAITLLTWRGLAQIRTKRPHDAYGSLQHALHLTDQPTTDANARARQRRDILVELATLAADAGDLSRTRDAIARALATATPPHFTRDRLRARPSLAKFIASAGDP